MKKDIQIKFDQILHDLQNKIYKPIYWLEGEEPYYIDIINDYIDKNVLSDTEKDFNQTILYGRDTDVVTITNTARRFPMMANYQVVIVREAQDVQKIEELISYAENPLNSTLLVINYKYKKLDGRKKIKKEIQKKGVFITFDKLYENELPSWIDNYIKKKKYSITPQASHLLAEFLGNDLSKIANELDKLIITLGADDKQITPTHIERNIGISKDYNNFELQNALGNRDIKKALRIIAYFDKNQKDHPIPVTIISLYGYFNKLLTYYFVPDKSPHNLASILGIHPFFVKELTSAAHKYTRKKLVNIIGILREYDLKSKGVGSSNIGAGELLKELVYKIVS